MPHTLAAALRLQLVFVIATYSAACDSSECSCGRSAIECYRQGSWWIARSENFHVCSLKSRSEAEATAHRCEQLRSELNAAFQLSEVTSWTPPCQVILYPNLRCYVDAVGTGAEATVGSSLVKPDRGRIRTRRIDLRADVRDFARASLPHELCHVLVADRFRERRAPLWYDEGLALLVDPDEKRQLHERDLREGLRRGTALRVAELLVRETYPTGEGMGVFYGQCAALTHLLLQEGAPAQLHRFATLLPTAGINDALQSTYGIATIAELEAKWAARHQYPPNRATASLLPLHASGEHIGFAHVVQ